ncbi:MAG TPA: group II intron reverse transcriptase/maturase [Candidatus Methylomirabilis sp.]|nr:group II intron reverse transcriptase/maturase [Candidatus Methylomirabilis sp.]
MNLQDARRQMARQQLELPLGGRGEAPRAERSGEASRAAHGDGRAGTDHLMERVVERGNAQAALKRVQRNQGSPGGDGMTVAELSEYLREHWVTIKAQLLAGTYQPQPVKRQPIPKPGGGVRELGIPCVLDRFIQQAILQVLQPRFDPTFSEHSYGFRPGRRAHDAVCAAQRFIQAGRRWVVDVDLAKFFDRVNHDVLMGRVAKRIADRRLLRLIRRYLAAGILADGVVIERHEGTPQGGPLSPLLANVLLDEVDRELETRGHAFARYADDCNVYVRSRRAGEDVLQTLRRLYGRLRLQINDAKSAVARPWDRTFLGYRFWVAPGRQVKRRVAPAALGAMKAQVRELTGRNRGCSIPTVVAELRGYLLGWKAYFRLADTPGVFTALDQWLRRRLRMVYLKQWKRGTTAFRELRARGVSELVAAHAASRARRWWATAHHSALHLALPAAHFDRLGLPRLAG